VLDVWHRTTQFSITIWFYNDLSDDLRQSSEFALISERVWVSRTYIYCVRLLLFRQ